MYLKSIIASSSKPSSLASHIAIEIDREPGLWLDTFFLIIKISDRAAKSKCHIFCAAATTVLSPNTAPLLTDARLSSLFYCKASPLRIQQEDILTMVQLTLHSKAVNLARRFSVQNEPDMMRAWKSTLVCFFVPFLVLKSSSHVKTYRRHLSHTLTEESFVEDDSFDDSPKKYTREFCTELSKHLVSEKALPMECYKFRDVVRDLKRRDTDTTHPTSWMSWDG